MVCSDCKAIMIQSVAKYLTQPNPNDNNISLTGLNTIPWTKHNPINWIVPTNPVLKPITEACNPAIEKGQFKFKSCLNKWQTFNFSSYHVGRSS